MAAGDNTNLGYRSWTGIATETTFGTAGTSPSFLEFVSNSLKLEIEELKSPAINTSRAFSRRFLMNKKVGGSLEWHLHPVDGVPILWHALGCSITSSTVTVGAYQHLAKPVNTLGYGNSKSLTFDVRKGDAFARRYTGCKINQLSIKADIGQPIMISADIVGKDGANDTVSTQTSVNFSTARPFLFQDGGFFFASTGALANTTTARESVIGFELTINNNIISDNNVRAIGTSTVMDLAPGMRELSLKLTMRADTTTTFDRFTSGESGAVRLNFTSAELITTGAAYSFEINMPKVYYNATDVEVSGPDVLTVEPQITAISDSNPATLTAFDIAFTLVNGVSGY